MEEMINLNVKKVAELAKLEFTDEELKIFSAQFESILEYISRINELELDNVPPMSSPLLDSQRLRKDERTSQELTRQIAVENAPRSKDGFFVVPKVVE